MVPLHLEVVMGVLRLKEALTFDWQQALERLLLWFLMHPLL